MAGKGKRSLTAYITQNQPTHAFVLVLLLLRGGLRRFKVKEFSVREIVPYPIQLSWEGDEDVMADGAADSPCTAGEGKVECEGEPGNRGWA